MSAPKTKDLHDLISRAKGREVHLPAGDYRLTKPLTLPIGLRLIGAGPGVTRVVCEGAGPALMFRPLRDGMPDDPLDPASHTLHLEGISFEVAPPAASSRETYDLFHIDGGTVTLNDCRFAGAYAWRDEAGGSEGDWEGGCGLQVSGEAVVEVARCEFTACVYGIRLQGGTATIHNCHLHHLQAIAIGIANSAHGDMWIHHCRIHDTTSEAFGEGIVFEGTGAGCIEHNECHANRKAGIRWGGAAGGGTVAGNHCHDNVFGIVVEQRGWPEVVDNRCERNEAGVLCSDHASPLVRGNVLANNHDGIAVPGRHYRLNNTFPSPRIEHNQIRGNTYGIYYGGMASGFARSNVIEGSEQAAVVIDDRANPCVTDNTIQANPGAAIMLKGLAAGLVFENRISSNGGPDLVEEASCVTYKDCPPNWAKVRAYWQRI